MKVCTYTNLCAGGALLLVLGFSACAGNKPAPAAAPAASVPAPDSAAPDMGGAPAGDDSAAPDDTGAAPSDDGSGDDSAGGDDLGKTPDPTKAKTPETRTTAVIAQVIQDHRKPFRACYDKAHKQLPNLKGNLTLHFVLDPHGNVKSAELNIERSDIKAPLAVDCAIKELKKLKFPASSRGMKSEVNYPFNFKPH